MKLKTLHHKVLFKAAPQAVYQALINAREHAALTGAKATSVEKAGGVFTSFDGANSGYNLFLSPGQRIVQAWTQKDFPAGTYTIADFQLKATKSGTRLDFTQAGIPENAYDWLDSGWKEYYWEPLKKHLEKKE
jgi:activator of HSP90 ATPase